GGYIVTGRAELTRRWNRVQAGNSELVLSPELLLHLAIAHSEGGVLRHRHYQAQIVPIKDGGDFGRIHANDAQALVLPAQGRIDARRNLALDDAAADAVGQVTPPDEPLALIQRAPGQCAAYRRPVGRHARLE